MLLLVYETLSHTPELEQILDPQLSTFLAVSGVHLFPTNRAGDDEVLVTENMKPFSELGRP